jgi:hypothetical protein
MNANLNTHLLQISAANLILEKISELAKAKSFRQIISTVEWLEIFSRNIVTI